MTTEIIGYALQNPLRTAAVVGTLGGLTTIISKNMDESTRNLLGSTGAAGGLYCVFMDSQGCAEATAFLTARALRLQSIEFSQTELGCSR